MHYYEEKILSKLVLLNDLILTFSSLLTYKILKGHPWIHKSCYQAGVNFINVKPANFTYECHFGSFFSSYLYVKKSSHLQCTQIFLFNDTLVFQWLWICKLKCFLWVDFVLLSKWSTLVLCSWVFAKMP